MERQKENGHSGVLVSFLNWVKYFLFGYFYIVTVDYGMKPRENTPFYCMLLFLFMVLSFWGKQKIRRLLPFLFYQAVVVCGCTFIGRDSRHGIRSAGRGQPQQRMRLSLCGGFHSPHGQRGQTLVQAHRQYRDSGRDVPQQARQALLDTRRLREDPCAPRRRSHEGRCPVLQYRSRGSGQLQRHGEVRAVEGHPRLRYGRGLPLGGRLPHHKLQASCRRRILLLRHPYQGQRRQYVHQRL